MKDHHFPPGLLFFLMGIISTIWFLIRIIPKPSRASYPCMQVSATIMSAFVVYLLSLGGITLALRKARQNLYRARYIAAGSFILVALVSLVISLTHGIQFANASVFAADGPDDGPNQPIGKAMGVNPGRVVWIWNPEATNENCTTTFDIQDWYWKPGNTNGKIVGNMFRNALNKIGGKATADESWDVLFHFFNNRKHQKNAGYTKGEKIFIKINQGTSRWLLTQEDKDKGYYYPTTLRPDEGRRRISFGPTETGPYIVLELLRELVNEVGVNQADISVGDPMTDIYGHNYDIWVSEFPGVHYIDKFSTMRGRTLTVPTTNDLLFYSDKTQKDKLYDVVEKADYLINTANLKPHLTAGISLTAKNHFGSQARATANHLHYSLIAARNIPFNGGYHKYRVQVDLMGNKYLGQNTLLYMVDGLFGGGSSETKGPVKYFMAPFNNDWGNSIFLSLDQVAIESVCYDFLRTEWNGINKHNASNNSNESNPNWNGVDDYIHQAADPSNWPAGILYDPDNSGKPLPSLGVHEHWNNAIEKQYTRNLGTGKGTELVSIPDTLVKTKVLVNNNKTNTLLIGTYTSSSTSDGIYVYDFNGQTGEVNLKSKVSGEDNPSYLTISRDGKHVYAVNEVRNGGISSFLFNSTSGELKFLNRVSSSGASPCYVSVDDKNKYVFAGNYGSGSLSAVPLKEDGSLGTDPQVIQQEGSSIDKGRQSGPHLHCTVLSPDNNYLLTSNLGTDKVSIYKIDGSKVSQPLTPAEPPFVAVKPGSGPRHLTFHPNSKYVYLIQEMGAIITVFDYNDGKLVEKQTITMLSPDFKGRVGAADIHISPDGKFLYGSNRGEANEVVIYSIDKNGMLKYVGRQSAQGKGPRNFAIDPSGNFLLVANQDSNEIIFFKRDKKTGLITPTGGKLQLSKPVCLKFVAIN